MSHDHADMSSTENTTGDAAGMTMMTFHTGTGDALWWSGFTPTSLGAYAGALVLLIALGILHRAMAAFGAWTEARARLRLNGYANEVRDALVAREGLGTAVSTDKEAMVQQRPLASRDAIRIATGKYPAWRWSVDVSRGLLQVLSAGLAYLLMLAVMTGNMGFFLAVLAGIFIGEVAFGRFRFSEAGEMC
ncbi:Ctr copper transporter [Protomyces lactucae-debilis]|uniref:Copper transport protein n=1 Tax=Protomyces lactucae-debilis TaxID=2754530 RepID=A0A1Y2FSH8_PROLT|nr:Ctr copper transporter [Protomyces lactucae-debilis]ORY86938.1 Ctr copper transporter [Protomyces lactucae-debilis]